MDIRHFLDKYKSERNIKSDEELAALLGTSKPAVDKWIQRNSLPYKWKIAMGDGQNIKNDSRIVHIPKLSITASAGGGNNLDNIDSFKSNGELTIDAETLKVSSKTLKSIKVEGYSMIPMLFPDSWVIFDECYEYKGEGLYVLNWDNTLMVKLLQLTPDGKLDIISTNKEYKSYQISLSDNSQLIFYIVGKVLRVVM